MTEIETEVLQSYKKILADKEITAELIEDIVVELSKETPNPEKLAELIKQNRKTLQDDKA